MLIPELPSAFFTLLQYRLLQAETFSYLNLSRAHIRDLTKYQLATIPIIKDANKV